MGQMDLKQILHVAIIKSGLSDAELSEKSGVSAPVINRFRRGVRVNMSLDNASKLLTALGKAVK